MTLVAAAAVPWLFIWQGLDFSDQGYLLTGYRGFFAHPEVTEDSGHMWLTNLVGGIWDALFGSLGVVGMRGLWALCMSLGMLLAFRLARSLSDQRSAALAVLATSVFLSDRRETWFSYNTLSSLLFVAASCALLYGLAARRGGWLVGAGVLIGISPFARFPNLLSAVLVSAIPFAAWLQSERRPQLVKDTGRCLLGIAVGVLGMLTLIWLRGDFGLYWRGVLSLFAPAMQNAGYASDDLAENFITDQGLAVAWGLGICAAGLATVHLLRAVLPVVRWAVVAMVAVLGVLVLAREGEPWRFAVTGTVYFVLTAIALGLWQRDSGLRVASWVLLVVVVIAPLGSNNGIKNAHMGLWLALPVLIVSLHTAGVSALAGEGSKLALVACLVLFGEGCHRAWTYTYRDAPRAALSSSVGHPQLRAQFTTPARARTVAEVLGELERRVQPGDYLLAYEGTPLLQYLTKTRPYLNRPWLMGWERPEVVQELLRDAPSRTGCLPVVVTTLKTTRKPEWPAGRRVLDSRPAQVGVRKQLRAFLQANRYQRKWSNGFFEISEPPSARPGACR